MTAQQLQDAMAYLPDDLIEETDRRRNRRRKTIPFRRYVAMAACFVMVFSAGLFVTRLVQPKGAAEMAIYEAAEAPAAAVNEMEQVAAEECAPAEQAMEERFASDSAAGITENRNAITEEKESGVLTLETPRITSGTANYSSVPRVSLIRTEAELKDYFTYYSYQYHFDGIDEAIGGYDSSWFAEQDLLLLAIHSVPAESACEITTITETADGWEIRVRHDAIVPEKADRTDYHLLLTIEKDQIPDEAAVGILLETGESAP